MVMSSENARLESIASDSWYARGVNRSTISHSFDLFRPHLRGRSILELGPAEGVMTDLLVATGMSVTVVDGSESFCRSIKARIPRATVVHSLFEEFDSAQRFDNIILGHVLEHVVDPVELIRQTTAWLEPEGVVMAAVPNSHSIHRQAAVLMGLLSNEKTLNEADIHHGHRRVFDAASFRECFRTAGFDVLVFGGYWLKPLSNGQIEASWTPEMLAAFMKLGECYPDIAGEIYIIAKQSQS
jgi:2-polyprenyl-3-methyl-5-hydroxy-6-metoxy-1,4-benzoquinol methylase